jgi:hypothetical protein
MARKKNVQKLRPSVCAQCGQTTHYVSTLNRGMARTLKTVAAYLKSKGINAVHARKEMEGVYITSNEVGNLSHIVLHGLLEHTDGEVGNYSLTEAGIAFLNGADVPRVVEVSKRDGTRTPVLAAGMTNILKLAKEKDKWTAVGYQIVEGRII